MNVKLKQSVEKLQAYFVNDVPYKAKLDANEGSNYLLKDELIFQNIQANLYPDSDSKILRQKMSAYYNCKPENIIAGNGSSELINMVINAYCGSGDMVISFEPSFSMYQTYCDLCGAKYIKVPCENNFTQNIDKLIAAANELNPKIIILCTPNNPTGYVTSRKDIVKLLDNAQNSIVIIDEAYIDFCGNSASELILSYDNLIVMRTMSKAFGLAGIRVGAMIGCETLIKYIWKVKIPYNINILSQYVAEQALNNMGMVQKYTEYIIEQRNNLTQELNDLGFKVYPSGANFIFVKSPIKNLYENLMSVGVLIRKFDFEENTYCRITIGTKEENEILICEIKNLLINQNTAKEINLETK